MKTAIAFAGQGSQYPGMGKDLYENNLCFKEIIDKAGGFVDFDIKKKMFDADEDELSKTMFAQPVISAFAYGVWSNLKNAGVQPDYVLGLSLGEYSALAASGVFDLETLVRVTAFRGNAMQKAGEGIDAKMIAVIGGDEKDIDDVCKKVTDETGKFVGATNFNSKAQTVISGISSSAEEAGRILKDKGMRCVPLKVSSAFHTEFMAPASEELKGYLENVTFGKMEIPVIFNVTGKEIDDGETIPDLLEKQIKSPVKMRHSIEYLKKQGIERVIEIGPGKVISGFVKKTEPDIETVNVEDTESLEIFLESI